MKRVNVQTNLAILLMAFGTLFSCQVDEEITEVDAIDGDLEVVNVAAKLNASLCRKGKRNTNREHDLPGGAVNDGKVDDRTCYDNYYESNVNNNVYGNYNIQANTNHFDSKLQPRIERSLKRSNAKSGSYVEFKGTVRILEVGNTSKENDNGTYIAQAKGKHTGGGGPRDPAICLFLAKPVYGRDAKGRWTQIAFDIYREQINVRGGSGKTGRSIVKLTRIGKGRPTRFELKVGFRTVNGEKVHYANAKIAGKNYFWNIPEPNRGRESGIRYGAYRVKGGTARIQWANTSFTRVNK
jgi:hypothetical protein